MSRGAAPFRLFSTLFPRVLSVLYSSWSQKSRGFANFFVKFLCPFHEPVACMFFLPSPCTNNVRSICLSDNKKRPRHKTSALNYMGIISLFGQFLFTFIFSLRNTVQSKYLTLSSNSAIMLSVQTQKELTKWSHPRYLPAFWPCTESLPLTRPSGYRNWV